MNQQNRTPKQVREPTPTKLKKSKLKLQLKFINEIIANEKDINNKIFSNYFIFKLFEVSQSMFFIKRFD